MSTQADHTVVRLRVPPELKAKIEESSRAHNRSMNADMVARLEQSFDAEDPIRSVLPSLSSIAEVSLAEHINRSVKEWLAEAKKQGRIPK